MKKFLFLAIAAAAMTSCSQDEVLEVAQKQAISFGNAFVGNSTRAAVDNTYGPSKLIDKFNVYGTVNGINIFNGNNVSRPNSIEDEYDASIAWELTGPDQYWVKDANYDFAAVVNSDIVTVNPDEKGMPKTLTYTTDETGTKDLLYATNPTYTANGETDGIVTFTFDHLLSKVWFTVTSDTEYTETTTDGTTTKSGYYYSVKNIKVKNITTGTYTIGATEPWSGSVDKYISFGNVDKVTKEAEKTNATQMLLIPTKANTYDITFDVQLWVNGEQANTKSYSCTVTPELKAGHSYNFIIALEQGDPIEFSVADVNTWVEDLNQDDNTTNDAISLTFNEVTTPAN